MGYPALLAKTNELVSAAQTMGALGAELRLRQMGKDGDPSVRGALQAVLRNLEPGLLEGLEPGQIAATIGLATYALQKALDLIREPERTPGWSYKEPAILAAFDLIWMASPFLPREVVDRALPRVVRALAPGGFLVFGIFASRPDPLNQALTDLLTIRIGGHPWRSEEVEEFLRALGLRSVECAGADDGPFVIGRRE
jgi:hypothetical protein